MHILSYFSIKTFTRIVWCIFDTLTMSYQGSRINPPSIVLEIFEKTAGVEKCVATCGWMLSVILCPRDLHMSSQKLERKYMYIAFEPKTITADAGHLNMSSIRVAMEVNEIIRASSTLIPSDVSRKSVTGSWYIYD